MSNDAQAMKAQIREHKLHLCGWVFFVTSASLFIVASLRAGDRISLLGSIFFFLACLPNVAALLLAMRHKDSA